MAEPGDAGKLAAMHAIFRSRQARLRSAAAALAVCAATIVSCVAAAPAPAEAQSPDQRALGSIDGALRFAIERQPEGLAKSLAASERICALGQGAEERGDVAAAAADWSTLTQTVELLDEPGLAAVELAFGAAIGSVDRVESRFERAWGAQPDRVRALRGGAKAVRSGLRLLIRSFADLRRAFTAWREHHCEAALAAIDAFTEAIPKGVAPINRGMERLWMVSAWKPAEHRRLAARIALGAPWHRSALDGTP